MKGKKILFLQQKDKHSCGAYAVYNLLVWQKVNPNPNDLKLIKNYLNTDENKGTYCEDMTQLLCSLPGLHLNSTLLLNPKAKQVLKLLSRDKTENTALIVSLNTLEGGHFSLLVRVDKRNFIIGGKDLIIEIKSPLYLESFLVPKYDYLTENSIIWQLKLLRHPLIEEVQSILLSSKRESRKVFFLPCR